MKRLALSASFLALACLSLAWDEQGHRVVARVAWDTLGKSAKGVAARDAFMHLLLEGDEAYAPGDLNDVDAFLDAANFPDAIKRKDAAGPFIDLADKFNDETYPVDFPGREKDGENTRCKSWHYYDTPLNLPPGFVVFERPFDARKAMKAASLGIVAGDPADKAWWAYWMLHLVGDLHQPLHCVSDFTVPEDPKTGLVTGDNGGNGFALTGNKSKNLHSFWDGSITRATAPTRSAARRAIKIQAVYPETAFGPEIDDLDFDKWADEGAVLAKETAYVGVANGGEPDEEYISKADQAAMRQAALAGYRLARLIERLLGR